MPGVTLYKSCGTEFNEFELLTVEIGTFGFFSFVYSVKLFVRKNRLFSKKTDYFFKILRKICLFGEKSNIFQVCLKFVLKRSRFLSLFKMYNIAWLNYKSIKINKIPFFGQNKVSTA